MKAETIRSVVKLPFHPFMVGTGGGGAYFVAHPELYWPDPDGEVLLVKDSREGVVLIDVESIRECVRAPRAGMPSGE